MHSQDSVDENLSQRKFLEKVKSLDSNIKPDNKLDSLIDKIGSLIDSYETINRLKEKENKAILVQIDGLTCKCFFY